MDKINSVIQFLKRNPFVLWPLMLILLPIIAALVVVSMDMFLREIGIENRKIRGLIVIGLVVILWTVSLIRNRVKQEQNERRANLDKLPPNDLN